MKKVKSTDKRLRHRETGLWLAVEHLGRHCENDTYTHDEDSASTFKYSTEAVKVAKRLGLQKSDFEII